MKRILLLVLAMVCTFGMIATSQQPQTPACNSDVKTSHKKVSLAEYRDLLTAINKLYGFDESKFNSVNDSIEVVPDMIKQYIHCLEKFYFYDLYSRDTTRVMPDFSL